MRRNFLDYLDTAARKWPGKTAFTDGKQTLSFAALFHMSRAAGSALCAYPARQPVAVFLPRGPAVPAAFFGVLHAGQYYVPLDTEMGLTRIAAILDNLKPRAAVCDPKTAKHLETLGFPGDILLADALFDTPEDAAALALRRQNAVDTDLMYVVFTSGSTGTPKGVAASHRNVIDYIEALSPVLGADEHTVFGSQSPLYLDACLKDVGCTLKAGASAVLIPKSLFSFPVRLLSFIRGQNINTLCWVVSALTIISGLGALEDGALDGVKTIAFGGEAFPPPQLKLWRGALPDTRFINLYGPTECTGMSCYYELPADFPDNTPVPIGRPFENTHTFLLDDEGREITRPGEYGELYIRGTCVTCGYANDAEKTAEAFVQNPLQSLYPETVYRTGDLAAYAPSGELLYGGRRDHQIKHMGYRIELLEIEGAAMKIPGVGAACCVYDRENSRIILFYTGTAEPETVQAALADALPRYMLPSRLFRREVLPRTPGGKLDRAGMLADSL